MNSNNNNNGKRSLMAKVLLWTFLANLIVGTSFYLAWSLIDMQQEIGSLEAERDELVGKLGELADYRNQNGHFQADFSKVLEELIQNLGGQ